MTLQITDKMSWMVIVSNFNSEFDHSAKDKVEPHINHSNDVFFAADVPGEIYSRHNGFKFNENGVIADDVNIYNLEGGNEEHGF